MRSSFFLIIAITLAGFIAGCYTDDDGPLTPQPPVVVAIQVWFQADSLRSPWSGDTARVQGWIVIKDSGGRGLAGLVVKMSLADSFGYIRYMNPELRDTTDEHGRVVFEFVTWQPGAHIITVECCGCTISFTLVIDPPPPPQPVCIQITVEPDTLWLSGGQHDSSLVTVCFVDSVTREPVSFPCEWPGDGISGVAFPLHAAGGSFRPLPPFDSTCCARTWLYLHSCGTFYVSTIDMCDDPACVVVLPR